MSSQSDQTQRDGLIDSIVAQEWELFQKVNNVGGRASCQDTPHTFSVMRRSQFAIWTDAMLRSYADDLAEAAAEGRNPVAEKYGYMMAFTHPQEYERIEDQLTPVSPEKERLVDAIVGIQMRWADEMAQKYPYFMAHGRPIHTRDEVFGATSIESYARGELKTYSERTLDLMLAHYLAARDAGQNLHEQSDEAQVKALGFENLEAAEKQARSLA